MANNAKTAPKPQKKKKRRLWRFLVLVVILILLAPLVGILLFGLRAKPAHADVIVVPGAALRKGGQELSDALRYRMDHAIELWHAGYAPKILLTGGGAKNDNEPRAMARYAVSKGVPAEALWLESGGDTTRKSADNIAKLFAQKKLDRALVVSNWYHVPRLRLALEQAGVETSASPADAPGSLAKEPEFVLREWVGLWAYAIKADGLRQG